MKYEYLQQTSEAIIHEMVVTNDIDYKTQWSARDTHNHIACWTVRHLWNE